MNNYNFFIEYVKVHNPVFDSISNNMEFCNAGDECKYCPVQNECNDWSISSLPTITQKQFEDFKKNHPEYFI